MTLMGDAVAAVVGGLSDGRAGGRVPVVAVVTRRLVKGAETADSRRIRLPRGHRRLGSAREAGRKWWTTAADELNGGRAAGTARASRVPAVTSGTAYGPGGCGFSLA